MPRPIVFRDAGSAGDALTFAGRAVRLGDGTVRLRANAGIMVMTAAPLAPGGAGDATPTVLGMRTLRVDPELECDLVIEAARLVADAEDPNAVRLPDTALAPAWAGISPPRRGWAPAAELSAATLAARAQWGIAAVAEELPTNAGEDVVRAVRARVWSEPDAEMGGQPRGVAFVAWALGFIGGDEVATVRTAGPWTRVTLRRGHVVVRARTVGGLTPIRSTG